MGQSSSASVIRRWMKSVRLCSRLYVFAWPVVQLIGIDGLRLRPSVATFSQSLKVPSVDAHWHFPVASDSHRSP